MKTFKKGDEVTWQTKSGRYLLTFVGKITGEKRGGPAWFGRTEYEVDNVRVSMPMFVTDEKLELLSDKLKDLLK